MTDGIGGTNGIQERAERPMRERMARAMCLVVHEGDTDEGWEHWLVQADAALDELMTPTIGMVLSVCAEAKKEQLRPIEVHRVDAGAFITAAMRAAKDGL